MTDFPAIRDLNEQNLNEILQLSQHHPDSANVLACAITIYCGFGVSKISRQAHE